MGEQSSEMERIRADLARVTAERDEARAHGEALFDRCSRALLGPIALSPCGTEAELAEGIEALRAERDRLQRACDEGLPREVILCPSCQAPHVEGPRHDDPTKDGRTRPHHTHRCYGCGHVWESGRWSFGVAPGQENEVTRRLRAAGLREALDACGDVKGRLLDAAMEGGAPINCREAFGEEDPLDADGGECELIAAGASLCGEAIEALIAKGGGA